MFPAGNIFLIHKAQVGADTIRPKEKRKKKKEEWWAGHPHPILRHNSQGIRHKAQSTKHKAQGTSRDGQCSSKRIKKNEWRQGYE